MIRFLVQTIEPSKVALAEVTGAALLVAGFATWLGVSAGLITAGVALLAKSAEWEMGGGVE